MTETAFPDKTVYIKPISHEDVKNLLGPEEQVPAGPLYSVHATNGARLAIVEGLDVAQAAAREYGMEPTLVH